MPGLKWLLAGFGLLFVSKIFESAGDAMPVADVGTSWERLIFHLTALGILLVGLFCFVRAGRVIFASFRSRREPPPPAEPTRLTAPAQAPQAPGEFDPDAALDRYLKRRDLEGEATPSAPRPIAGGFGRRGL